MLEIILQAVHFGLEVLQLPVHLLGPPCCLAHVLQDLHVQLVWALKVHVLGEAKRHLERQWVTRFQSGPNTHGKVTWANVILGHTARAASCMH